MDNISCMILVSQPDVSNDWYSTYRWPHHCSGSRAATGYGYLLHNSSVTGTMRALKLLALLVNIVM